MMGSDKYREVWAAKWLSQILSLWQEIKDAIYKGILYIFILNILCFPILGLGNYIYHALSTGTSGDPGRHGFILKINNIINLHVCDFETIILELHLMVKGKMDGYLSMLYMLPY